MIRQRSSCLLASLLLAALPGWADGGAGRQGGVAVYQGAAGLVVFSDWTDCSAYAPASLVFRTRLTYVALPGVCDDLGEKPCAGRLTAEFERCQSGNAALSAGSLSGGYSRNRFRMCYQSEPHLPAACDGVNQVAEGSWVGAGWVAGDDRLLSGTALLRLTRSRSFQMDGDWVRVSLGSTTQHFSQPRPDAPPDSCAAPGGPGCGVVGVGL